jgi:acyl-CoA thioesterase
MLSVDNASRALGMRLISAGVGKSCVEMKIREDMLNGHRTAHGGILFSLADSAFAFACNSRNQRNVVAAAHMDFLRPAILKDVLRATAIEHSLGSRLGLYDVTVRNQRGETVAVFRGKSCRIEGRIIEELPVIEKKREKAPASKASKSRSSKR